MCYSNSYFYNCIMVTCVVSTASISNIEHISLLCNSVTGGDSPIVATQASVSTCTSMLRGKDGSSQVQSYTTALFVSHPAWVDGGMVLEQSLASYRIYKLHTGSVRYQ